MTCFVYFVRCQDYVKIGWSRQPERRIAILQNAVPFQLEILGIHPGTATDEFLLHERFASLRVRQEWFVRSPEIEAVARGGFEPVKRKRRAQGYGTHITETARRGAAIDRLADDGCPNEPAESAA